MNIASQRCLNCLAECDGDACSPACVNALYAALLCPCGNADRQKAQTRFTGTNDCACCGLVSPLYDLFATCRECRGEFCEACSAEERQDHEKRSRTICRLCAEAA